MIHFPDISGIRKSRHIPPWSTSQERSPGSRSVLHHSLCGSLWEDWHEDTDLRCSSSRGICWAKAGITCLLDYCIVKDTWLIGSSCRVRSCCNYFGVLNLLNLHLPKSPVKKSRVSHCTQKANYLWHALYWQYKICVNMTFTKNTMRMQKFVFRRLNFRLIFVTCSSCFFNWASVLS